MGYSGQSCEERTKELDFQQHLRCCVVVVAAVTRRLFGENVCVWVGWVGSGSECTGCIFRAPSKLHVSWSSCIKAWHPGRLSRSTYRVGRGRFLVNDVMRGKRTFFYFYFAIGRKRSCYPTRYCSLLLYLLSEEKDLLSS
jgi:hypothetical protein